MKKSPEAVLEVEEEGRGLLAPMTVTIDDEGLDEDDPRRSLDSRVARLAPESHAGRNSLRPGSSRRTCPRRGDSVPTPTTNSSSTTNSGAPTFACPSIPSASAGPGRPSSSPAPRRSNSVGCRSS